jgi:hypothetical protein
MSKSFVSDPAVNVMLDGYETRERDEILKGFSDPVAIVQIKP